MKIFKIIWPLLLICFCSMAYAQPTELSCLGQDKCEFTLDEQALKNNIAARITKALQDRGSADALVKPEMVEILKAIPFQIGQMQLFAIKMKVLPISEGQKSMTNYLVVDSSGSINFVDLQELATGKSLAFEAMALAKKEKIPENFGSKVLEGQGTAEIILVSDPICPYCRKAVSYFIENMDKIKHINLLHLPLPSHPGADTACAVIIFAEKHNLSPEDVVKFAYTQMQAVPLTGKEEDKVKFSKIGILKQFLKAFPEMEAKLGSDPEKALEALEKETQATLEADMQMAADQEINFTPVMYVNGIRINGFKVPELDAALAKSEKE